MHQGGAAFVEFLCSCDADGASLRGVMEAWLKDCPYFLRSYHVKVSCAALANLLATGDGRLLGLMLPVEVPAAEGDTGPAARTRARRQPTQFVEAPLPTIVMRELVRRCGPPHNMDYPPKR